MASDLEAELTEYIEDTPSMFRNFQFQTVDGEWHTGTVNFKIVDPQYKEHLTIRATMAMTAPGVVQKVRFYDAQSGTVHYENDENIVFEDYNHLTKRYELFIVVHEETIS